MNHFIQHSYFFHSKNFTHLHRWRENEREYSNRVRESESESELDANLLITTPLQLQGLTNRRSSRIYI